MDEQEKFEMCDKLLLKPFNLVISEEIFIKLIEIIEDQEIDEFVAERKFKEIFKDKKKRRSSTVRFLTYKTFHCETCYKILFCELKAEGIEKIGRVFPKNKKTRILFDYLNYDKKNELEFFGFESTEADKKKKEEIKTLKKQRLEYWENYFKGLNENGEKNETENF